MAVENKIKFNKKNVFQNIIITLSFPLVIFLLLYFDFRILGFYFGNLVKSLNDVCFNGLYNTVIVQNMPEVVRSFLFFGVFKSIGAFLIVLPYVCVWYLIIAVLKECEYFKNVANATRNSFKFTGISSSNLYGLITGFGCCACIHFEARNLKEKILLYFLSPFFSCGAKIPFYILLSFAFSPKYGELIVFCLYFFGVLAGVVLIAVINKLFIKNVPESYTVSDCNFKIPAVKNILSELIFLTKDFVKKVFLPVFVALIFVWILANFNLNFRFVGDVSESILYVAGRILNVFIQSFGISDPKISALLFGGFFAKESINTISIFNGAEELAYNYRKTALAVCMVIFVVSTPCFAMIVNIKREIGLKYAILLPVLQCVSALACAYILSYLWLLIYVFLHMKSHRAVIVC